VDGIFYSPSHPIHQKGNHGPHDHSDQDLASDDHPTDNHVTPIPWDDVQVFRKVSFSHTIIGPTNKNSKESLSGTIVNGRVDHGLGRILPCRDPMKPLSKRRFQTLLVVVEVKPPYNFISSFPQLVVYLAALHQSRLRRKRSDTSVYGVLSDGYRFTFVRITHNGSLEHSKCFDITQGDIETILGCMKYILEKSSPNVTCKMDGSESVGDEGDSDEEMDVDG